MRILVTAKPGSKIESVTKLADAHYLVSVKERAVGGKANKAIELALAEHFGIKPYLVEIVSGHRGKQKQVEIVV